MNSILYFGSDTVKFLRGSAGKNRVTIQDAATVRLDEGILLNGVITDERRLCEALNGLQPRIGKHVDIVVESSEIQHQGGRDPVPVPGRDPPDRPPRIRSGRRSGRRADIRLRGAGKSRGERKPRPDSVLRNEPCPAGRLPGAVFCHGGDAVLLRCRASRADPGGFPVPVVRPFGLCPHYGGTEPYVLCALRGEPAICSPTAPGWREIPNRRNMPPGWRRGCRPSSSSINPKKATSSSTMSICMASTVRWSPDAAKRRLSWASGRSSTGLSPDRPERPVDAGTYLAAVGGLIGK